MCIRAQYSDASVLVPWDPVNQLVSVPAGLSRGSSLRVLRAVLEQLAVPQPPVGARCFCGAPVKLLPCIPNQRRSEQVMRRGA